MYVCMYVYTHRHTHTHTLMIYLYRQNSIESEQSKRLEEGSAAMKTLNASLMSLQVL